MVNGGAKMRAAAGVALTVVLLSACGGGTPERPLDSFTAEEIYRRAEFELEERNPDEAAR